MMNIIAIILAVCLVGCSTPIEKPIEPVEPISPVVSDNPIPEILSYKNVGFNEFDSSMISFIDEKKENENYMISPLSFKYALGLSILGANGETESQLYKAVGYDNFEEFEKLSNRMDILNKNFNEYNDSLLKQNWYSKEEIEDMKIDFSIANSVWDVWGDMKDSYIKMAKEKLNADAFKTSSANASSDVNNWVNDKTHGLIPTILEDTPIDLAAILVNTVYLKSSWFSEFVESMNPINFTDVNGNIVKKEAINNTGNFDYYKDEDTELVIVQLNGGVNIAYVLGSTENILEKIENSKSDKEVRVEVPKMDIETSLDKKELVDYLIDRGAELPFLPNADFSKLSDDVYIGDIIQKTKIKTDEKGLEAAAATAVLIVKNTAFIEKEEPIEFVADKPFSFYVYTDINEVKDLMFYGEYVK